MWSAGTPERPALFVLPQVAAPADARPATPPRASGCSLPERSFVTTKTVVVAAAALPRTRPTVSKSEARSPGGTARHAFWGPSPTASLLQVRVSDVFTPEPAMHVVETGGTVRNCQQRSGTIWHSEASRAVWPWSPTCPALPGFLGRACASAQDRLSLLRQQRGAVLSLPVSPGRIRKPTARCWTANPIGSSSERALGAARCPYAYSRQDPGARGPTPSRGLGSSQALLHKGRRTLRSTCVAWRQRNVSIGYGVGPPYGVVRPTKAADLGDILRGVWVPFLGSHKTNFRALLPNALPSCRYTYSVRSRQLPMYTCIGSQ